MTASIQGQLVTGFYYGQRLRKYISRGMTDEAIKLIMRGCDVNTGDGEGLTSLHYAAQYNKPKPIEAILEHLGSIHSLILS